MSCLVLPCLSESYSHGWEGKGLSFKKAGVVRHIRDSKSLPDFVLVRPDYRRTRLRLRGVSGTIDVLIGPIASEGSTP